MRIVNIMLAKIAGRENLLEDGFRESIKKGPEVDKLLALVVCLLSHFAFSGTFDIAYSANAVIVRLGFTPGLAGMIEPSTM